ncbi:unnamed protein product [Amoebophrya sp. A120]|nr:unnamed protein product [Amoebophrya sp. A120]|eukprot:GSA120T00025979001.1
MPPLTVVEETERDTSHDGKRRETHINANESPSFVGSDLAGDAPWAGIASHGEKSVPALELGGIGAHAFACVEGLLLKHSTATATEASSGSGKQVTGGAGARAQHEKRVLKEERNGNPLRESGNSEGMKRSSSSSSSSSSSFQGASFDFSSQSSLNNSSSRVRLAGASHSHSRSGNVRSNGHSHSGTANQSLLGVYPNYKRQRCGSSNTSIGSIFLSDNVDTAVAVQEENKMDANHVLNANDSELAVHNTGAEDDFASAGTRAESASALPDKVGAFQESCTLGTRNSQASFSRNMNHEFAYAKERSKRSTVTAAEASSGSGNQQTSPSARSLRPDTRRASTFSAAGSLGRRSNKKRRLNTAKAAAATSPQFLKRARGVIGPACSSSSGGEDWDWPAAGTETEAAKSSAARDEEDASPLIPVPCAKRKAVWQTAIHTETRSRLTLQETNYQRGLHQVLMNDTTRRGNQGSSSSTSSPVHISPRKTNTDDQVDEASANPPISSKTKKRKVDIGDRSPKLGPDVNTAKQESSSHDLHANDEQEHLAGKNWIFPGRRNHMLETPAQKADYEAAEEAYRKSDTEGDVVARYGFNLALRCAAHPSAIAETRAGKVAIPKDLEIRIPVTYLEQKLISSTQLETITLAVLRTDEKFAISEQTKDSQLLATNAGHSNPKPATAADPMLDKGGYPYPKGFLLGEGTGCGKGRMVTGVMLHHWNSGNRRSIWCSKKKELLKDAQRDFADMQVPREMQLLDTRTFATQQSSGDAGDGVVFCSYRWLANDDNRKLLATWFNEPPAAEKGEDAVPTNAGQKKYFGSGVLAFDECHAAKNQLRVKYLPNGDICKKASESCGVAVVEMQMSLLKEARVLYVSATAAAELSELAYMARLGAWEKVGFDHLRRTFAMRDASPLGGMAALGWQLRTSGAAVSRRLSLEGVQFDIGCGGDLHVATAGEGNGLLDATLHDKVVALFHDTSTFFHSLLENHGREYVKAAEAANPGRSGGVANFRGIFTAARQKFWKQFAACDKLPAALGLARRLLAEGKQVVLALQSTGEAAMTDRDDTDGDDAGDDVPGGNADDVDQSCSGRFSLCESIAVNFLKTYCFDSFDANQAGPEQRRLLSATSRRKRDELIARWKGLKLPENALDHILNSLGGPEKVAEISGRSRRLLLKSEGEASGDKPSRYESATRPVDASLKEIEAFQAGQKRVAIITAAGSTGVSLHAHKADSRARHMIILELPWSSMEFTQQIGRVHRSGQAHLPAYTLITSSFSAVEARFVCALARRIKLLGAFTRGRAEHGNAALDALLDESHFSHGKADDAVKQLVLEFGARPQWRDLAEQCEPKYNRKAHEACGTRVTQFLNCLPQYPKEEQEKLFDRFLEMLGHQKGNDNFGGHNSEHTGGSGSHDIKDLKFPALARKSSRRIVERRDRSQPPVTGKGRVVRFERLLRVPQVAPHSYFVDVDVEEEEMALPRSSSSSSSSSALLPPALFEDRKSDLKELSEADQEERIYWSSSKNFNNTIGTRRQLTATLLCGSFLPFFADIYQKILEKLPPGKSVQLRRFREAPNNSWQYGILLPASLGADKIEKIMAGAAERPQKILEEKVEGTRAAKRLLESGVVEAIHAELDLIGDKKCGIFFKGDSVVIARDGSKWTIARGSVPGRWEEKVEIEERGESTSQPKKRSCPPMDLKLDASNRDEENTAAEEGGAGGKQPKMRGRGAGAICSSLNMRLLRTTKAFFHFQEDLPSRAPSWNIKIWRRIVDVDPYWKSELRGSSEDVIQNIRAAYKTVVKNWDALWAKDAGEEDT